MSHPAPFASYHAVLIKLSSLTEDASLTLFSIILVNITISHILTKTIFWLPFLDCMHVIWFAAKAAKFREIMQNNNHYAVQGHATCC